MMRVVLLVCVGLVFGASEECSSGLIHRWTMDEYAGRSAFDLAPETKHNLALPTNFDFIIDGNPQGLGALKLADQEGFDVVEGLVRPSSTTMSMWFKTTNTTQEMALFSWMSDDHHFYLRMIPGGKLGFYSSINLLRVARAATGLTYNDGDWHFVVAIYDDATRQGALYVDPHTSLTNVPELEINTGLPVTHNRFRLGANSRELPLPFHGHLDDVRMYNRILPLADMRAIARLQDTPCFTGSVSTRSSVVLVPGSGSKEMRLDTSDLEVCGSADPSACRHNRFGISMTVCAGSIAGFTLSMGGRVEKHLGSAQSACGIGFDGSAWSRVTADSTLLCAANTSPLLWGVRVGDTPVAADVHTTMMITADHSDLVFEAKAVSGNASYTSPGLAISSYGTPVVECQAKPTARVVKASWTVPILSNGAPCTKCLYQAWYVPASKVAEEGVNLHSLCGTKLHGTAVAGQRSLTTLDTFDLPADVPVPADDYIWVVVASSVQDNAEGVAAVLSTCHQRHIPGAPTPAPPTTPTTAEPTTRAVASPFVAGAVTQNSLKLNLVFDYYTEASAAAGLKASFVANITKALTMEAARIVIKNLTRGSIIVHFDFMPPVIDSKDTRTAPQLSAELAAMHGDAASELFRRLDEVDKKNTSFSYTIDGAACCAIAPTIIAGLDDLYFWIIVGAGALLLCLCGAGTVCLCKRGGSKTSKKKPAASRDRVKVTQTTRAGRDTLINTNPSHPTNEKAEAERAFPVPSPPAHDPPALDYEDHTHESFAQHAQPPLDDDYQPKYRQVTCDWAGQEANDLVLTKGEWIEVLHAQITEGPDWVWGRNTSTRREGLCPVTYLGQDHDHLPM